MLVTVNLQPLLAPLTGIGHYTRELTRELVVSSKEGGVPSSVMGLAGLGVLSLDEGHPMLSSHEPVATSASPRYGAWQFARRYLRNPVTRFAYNQALSQRLRLHALTHREAREGLYWEPNFIRLPWPGKSVVTVHDLSHCRHPEYHPQERVKFFNDNLASSLDNATRINVVSEFTACELQDVFGVASQKIDIVPPGVSERFLSVTEADSARVRIAHALPERYCLSVGTLEPRKNLAGLLQAFLAQSVERQHACPLLLVGLPGWGTQSLSTEARAALADGRLRRLGYIEDLDLPALYANATLFAYVSHYEGFGMPVIEAMAAGVPVVTADRTATREVAGDSALCVPPDDIDAIRQALELLQDDDALRSRLIQSGRHKAKQYTWAHSATALKDSFELAMGR